MSLKKHLSLILTSLLLAACVAAYLWTADPDRPIVRKPNSSAQYNGVDERIMQTARRMASAADTVEEQELAREALRLADNELDQAYASALREATAPGPPPTGEVKKAAEAVTITTSA